MRNSCLFGHRALPIGREILVNSDITFFIIARLTFPSSSSLFGVINSPCPDLVRSRMITSLLSASLIHIFYEDLVVAVAIKTTVDIVISCSDVLATICGFRLEPPRKIDCTCSRRCQHQPVAAFSVLQTFVGHVS